MNTGTFPLTTDQQAVVDFPVDQPLKVIAGAGTGKTTVLWRRFEALVKRHGFHPREILVLTFTRKAAAELRRRITAGLNSRLDALQTEIYNFDSFWWKILQDNRLAAGIDADTAIIGEADRILLRSQAVDDLVEGRDTLDLQRIPDIDGLKLRSRLAELLELRDYAQARLLTGDALMTFLRNCMNAAEPVPQEARPCVFEQQYLYLFERVNRRYEHLLAEDGLLEFGDVLCRTWQLLQAHREIQEFYRRRYRYILVDEAQDTSFAQFAVIRLLSAPDQSNVTIVGDDKQSIYLWRGAYIQNIQDFQGHALNLRDNFRSYNEILDVANWIICQDPSFAAKADEIGLRNPQKGGGQSPTVRLFEASDRRQEAQYLVHAIAQERQRGIQYGHMAILIRRMLHQDLYVQHLTEAGIPVAVNATGILNSQGFKDLYAILKFYIEPSDDHAFYRLLQMPPAGLNMASLYLLSGHMPRHTSAEENSADWLTALRNIMPHITLTDDPFNRINGFLERWESLREKGLAGTVVSQCRQLFERSGFLDAAMADVTDLGFERREALRYTLQEIRRLECQNPMMLLTDMIDRFTRCMAENAEDRQIESPVSMDAVTVMTIHRAKGLEFPVVFYADAVDRTIRQTDQFLLDIHPVESPDGVAFEGLGFVSKYGADGAAGGKTERWELLHETGERNAAMEAEEIRLRYVAVTRAMDRLYITSFHDQDKRQPNNALFQQLYEHFREAEGIQSDPAPAHVEGAGAGQAGMQAELNGEEEQAITDAVQRLKRLEPERDNAVGRRPLELSFSSLAVYWQCPQLYMYRYVLGYVDDDSAAADPLEPAEDESSAFNGLLFGILMHRILHRCEDTPERMLAALQEEFLRNDVAREQFDAVYREVGQRICTNYHALGYPHRERLYSEQPFIVHLTFDQSPAVRISGIIDRIQRGDGDCIIDFKTNRTLSSVQRDLYIRQLHLYRFAAEQHCFPGVSAPGLALSLLYQGREERLDYDAVFGVQLLQDLKDIAAKNFKVDPVRHSNRNCPACTFRNVCRQQAV